MRRQPAERQRGAGRAVIAAVVQLGALSHSGTQGSAHSPAGSCFALFPRGEPCRDRGVFLGPIRPGLRSPRGTEPLSTHGQRLPAPTAPAPIAPPPFGSAPFGSAPFGLSARTGLGALPSQLLLRFLLAAWFIKHTVGSEAASSLLSLGDPACTHVVSI